MTRLITLTAAALMALPFFGAPDRVTLPADGKENPSIALAPPVVTDFLKPVDGARGTLYFTFPDVDLNGNKLDRDKLFYNIIIDGDEMALYPDEYPEEVSPESAPITDIPFSLSGTEIWNAGTMHCFNFFVYEYDTFAIRTKYVDGDYTAYSKTVYAYGNEGIPGPEGLQLTLEVPDGKRTSEVGGTKEGGYFYYAGGADVEYADMDCNIARYFIAGDKVYLQKSLTKVPISGMLVGTLDSDRTVTFDFPQYLHHVEAEDSYGEKTVIDIYALVCSFRASEEDPAIGSFYPSEEKQTLRFKLEDDGSLKALDEDLMIGSCQWVTTQIDPTTGKENPLDEPYWSWDGNGDIITGLIPFEQQPQEVPGNVNMEEGWVMIAGETGTPVKVGVKDGNLYLTGIYPESYCVTGPIIGSIDGNKVRFPGGQFIAADYDNGIPITFKAGYADGRDICSLEELVFDYDPEKGSLTSSDIAVFLSTPTKIIHYVEAPYIVRPDISLTGKELFDPVINSLRLSTGNFPGELEFDFPNVDKAGNLLDGSRLSYKVYVDDEEFVLYSDEYAHDMPNGEDYITEISYDWNGNYLYRIGRSHFFSFFFMEFEKLAIRTFYHGENGDTTCSNMVYVPGYGADKDGIADTLEEDCEAHTEYFDMQGRKLTSPAPGTLCLKVVHNSDGQITVNKIINNN